MSNIIFDETLENLKILCGVFPKAGMIPIMNTKAVPQQKWLASGL
jgi:hypothetical protein